uniref:Uncharacterized protein n=1 Tax=Octopus bimaculoides TaxID=37653 RepID=A0A0L8FL69_OCTBM
MRRISLFPLKKCEENIVRSVKQRSRLKQLYQFKFLHVCS